MNQLHPDVSLVAMLELILSADVHYHLYTAPITEPGLDAVLGDFTEEAGAGYGIVTVTPADWTITGVAGHQGFAIAPDIAFTPNVGTTFTNYGYYVTDATNTVLLAFGFFDAAPIITVGPLSLTMTPKFGNNSKYIS